MAITEAPYSAATTSDWDDQSDLGLSWSDTESYTEDNDSETDEVDMPVAGKRSREMTLGGLVFNSSQFTANAVLEQSLTKLLTSQGVALLSADSFPNLTADAKRTKSPETAAFCPPVKDVVIAAPPVLPKRVASNPMFEVMKSKIESSGPKIEASSHSAYEYNTEMNVADIMAMRNLTQKHGARAFAKTKSLSAPDLTAPSLFGGNKQLDELEEEDESSDSDSEAEGESEVPTSKPNRQVLSDFSKTSPNDYLQTLVKETFGLCPETVPSCDIQDYFLQITPDMISSYDMDVATAVRNEDLRFLNRIHRKGRTLQCCNRFGESIIHTVCRRGSIKMLQFLMESAQISLKVKCDYGRTPLHDACWTRDPNFDLIAIVLKECPDFLWMTDKRGFTPLTYVQRDQWGMWCVFLEEHKLLLKPEVI